MKTSNAPFYVVLKGQILCHQHCLAILLDHMEVISGIDTPLE